MSPQEFSSAYTSNFNLTCRFLISRGIAAVRAEELAQAAWSRAWERQDQLRDIASIAAWVNTIALNLLRGDIRRSRPQVELADRDRPYSPRVDQRIDAETILENLGERDRRLMILHVVTGLSSKEIAATSNLSAVAVRVASIARRRSSVSGSRLRLARGDRATAAAETASRWRRLSPHPNRHQGGSSSGPEPPKPPRSADPCSQPPIG